MIQLLTLNFKKQAAAGTAAGVATALATGGVSAKAAAIGLGAFVAATGATLFAVNKLTEGLDTNSAAIQKNSQVVVGHLRDLGRIAQATAAANFAGKKLITTTTALNKKTKEQLATEKAIAALRKLGVKPTNEKDPIQLEAARLNLLKQGNLEEERRVAALLANMEAQMKLNEAAQRYADLLQVLADQVITDEEVSVLAQKWQITKNEVLEYIARIYAANSTDIDDGPIINLLMKWGLTKEEAEKYVDFTRALKDEKIDDSEIEELMGKWGMTRQGVLDYAKTVQDGTALQAALSKGYALPGDEAAEAWKRALAALNAYLAALGAKPSVSAEASDRASIAQLDPDIVAGFLAGDPDAIKAVEAHANAQGTFAESELALADALLAESLAALGNLGLSPEDNNQSDERARLTAMGTFDSPTSSGFDPASFRMADNAGMTINVNVAGNVQTEQDLADAIRQRILLEQASGNPILFVGGL
jgi:hypothetical protein